MHTALKSPISQWLNKQSDKHLDMFVQQSSHWHYNVHNSNVPLQLKRVNDENLNHFFGIIFNQGSEFFIVWSVERRGTLQVRSSTVLLIIEVAVEVWQTVSRKRVNYVMMR